jgi:hypothetical protein
MREKEEKNGYKSLSAMGSTTISSIHIQNDDYVDDGRRSGVRAHSTCIDEMFIFTSLECKYFVYTFILIVQKKKIELTSTI